ncbi:hypothetical protein RB195_025822 [Necator americanus]|uniref:Uncharacterized protein n=2 Tax=Necator americanus TaxID=51031 RepID=A0ABR1EU13_NECAM|nr:Glutaredoxin [Necator americanus]ETN87217.1 Glutaredoxin [Necator americanus]
MKLLIVISLFVFINADSNETKEEEIAARISTDIHGHKVLIYSKTYCPYSKKLKRLLSYYPIKDLKVIELDRQKEMKGIQNSLKRITGRSTVPQLFIDGEFVGGHDETRAMEDRGELRKLLERARAL